MVRSIHSVRKKIKTRAFLFMIDSIIWKILSFFRKYFYSWTGSKYSFKEAFFWPKCLDYWMRNSTALEFILENARENALILDIGSGRGGLSEFFGFLKHKKRIRLVICDLDRSELSQRKNNRSTIGKVCSDAPCLSFKDKSFDYVVALDLLEHIPPKDRQKFIDEMNRVAKYGILLHCPMTAKNGKFQADIYDALFQKAHELRFWAKEPFTEQHMTNPYPSSEEMELEFPEWTIRGDQNAESWLKYMLFYRRPVLGYLCGFLYLFKWQSLMEKEPFYSAFLYKFIK